MKRKLWVGVLLLCVFAGFQGIGNAKEPPSHELRTISSSLDLQEAVSKETCFMPLGASDSGTYPLWKIFMETHFGTIEWDFSKNGVMPDHEPAKLNPSFLVTQMEISRQEILGSGTSLVDGIEDYYTELTDVQKALCLAENSSVFEAELFKLSRLDY
ncbi:MAG: hypothetical protein V1793_00510 [Pseudomonadota bacterium]